MWLTVSDRLTLAATWPADADADRDAAVPAARRRATPTGEGRRALAVRHGGQLLGVLRLQERPGLALTSVEERLFAGLAAQAGLVLRLVGLRAELEDRHAELVARAEELKASRERLIETQDAERRRLERDIHDGAQQHLVALAVNLRLAQTHRRAARRNAPRACSPSRPTRRRSRSRRSPRCPAGSTRGCWPTKAWWRPCGPRWRPARSRSPIDADGVARLPAAVEAALYFCCMEAVQNAAKHSGAGTVSVRLGEDRATWRLTVTDDGTGFDQTQRALRRPGRDWPTCATGWTPSAGR